MNGNVPEFKGNQDPETQEAIEEITQKINDLGSPSVPNQRLQDEALKNVNVRVQETKSSVVVLFSSPVESINFSVAKARVLALALRQAANRLEKRQREKG